MRTVYLNGEFVHESEAKLSIYDLSVMQAAAAFEMTRSFHGQHFKLREHLERLKSSCEILGLPFAGAINIHGTPKAADPMQLLEQFCWHVTQLNNHGPGEEHRLLIVVSPGCAPMYKDLDGVIPHPFLYIADFPLRYTVAGFGTYFTEGVHCITSPIRQVPDDCVPSAAKHRSRLHFHLAQQQALQGTWPLLRDPHYGWIREAPGANVMFVEHYKGQDFVHHCDQLALHGISMQTAVDLTGSTAATLLLPFSQHHGEITELWLTGTPFCMLPVLSLDGKPIGNGKPGPIYQQTLQKWNDLVGLDIAQQILDWDAKYVARPDTTQRRTDLALR